MQPHPFHRDSFLKQVHEDSRFDLVVIGGGATGLGVAVDGAARGLRTLLLEQHDFAKGTSSRSTKLVHGGVRYLAMGDVKLVHEALRERGILFSNAPHLAHSQPFVIPCYSVFSKWKYLIGLKLYDWLAGKWRIGKSTFVSKTEVRKSFPFLKPGGLKGGVRYFDGQFDDARLAVNLARTAAAFGAAVINYCRVTDVLKSESGRVNGVCFVDGETGESYRVQARAVVNATGVFVDDILRMDTGSHKPLVKPSQGTHIVINNSFIGGKEALMIPKTSDGRVLFGVPWHNHLVVGTTDIPVDQHSLEPRATDQEIDFILNTASNYFTNKPTRTDVLSVFAGLRPLAAPATESGSTKEISRSHKLIISASGLITITGGKWTTYRKMAEDTVDQVLQVGGIQPIPCPTTSIKIHGHTRETQPGHWGVYGSDAPKIQHLAGTDPAWQEKLHAKFDHLAAEVIWAARHEMARTVEDILARRLRILFLDAAAALEMAPKVAQLMAAELGKDDHWIESQLTRFRKTAETYLLAN